MTAPLGDHLARPFDWVTVLRLVGGERPPAYSRAERRAAVRVMLDAGVPRRIVAERLGMSLTAARRLCCRLVRP